MIIGARPNFMKAFPVYEALKKIFDLTLIHTGQHFDAKMSDVFFNQLKFPKPDIHLTLEKKSKAGDYDDKLYVNNDHYLKDKNLVIKELMNYDGDLGQLGEIRDKLKLEFEKIKPELVIVFGDITSTIAAGIASKILNIELAHVESGLRSGDLKMPEEVNRILTDHISKYYFVTEQSGVDNLQAIGITENVYLVGNTMIDTQKRYLQQALDTKYHETLEIKSREYVLITLHRPSNVDDLNQLREIFDNFEELSKSEKLVYPIHPRTKNNLEKIGYLEKVKSNPNIILDEPLGYLEFTCLIANCKYVITDSGGLQEESTSLDIPCFTLRENTERPSTLIKNKGTNQLINKISEIELKECKNSIDLWDGKSSERIFTELLNIFPEYCVQTNNDLENDLYKNSYRFKTININKLDCDIIKGNFHYNYKNCDFLFKKKQHSKYLLITFHASVDINLQLPIFRCWDFNEDNIDVLCISDMLMNFRKYNKSKTDFDSCFYLNCDNEHSIYREIISSVIHKYNKSIFFGTSAGGLGALIFASYFNSIALLGNSPLYINDWWNIENTKCVLKKEKKNLEILDIEDFLLKNGPPKLLILFTNVKDEISPFKKHHQPLINFFENKFPNHILPIYHDVKNKNNYHTSHFANYNYIKLIKQIFIRNCNYQEVMEKCIELLNGNDEEFYNYERSITNFPKIFYVGVGKTGSTTICSRLYESFHCHNSFYFDKIKSQPQLSSKYLLKSIFNIYNLIKYIGKKYNFKPLIIENYRNNFDRVISELKQDIKTKRLTINDCKGQHEISNKLTSCFVEKIIQKQIRFLFSTKNFNNNTDNYLFENIFQIFNIDIEENFESQEFNYYENDNIKISIANINILNSNNFTKYMQNICCYKFKNTSENQSSNNKLVNRIDWNLCEEKILIEIFKNKILKQKLYNETIIKKAFYPKILLISQGRSGSTCFFNEINKKLRIINPNHTYHTEISHLKNSHLINNNKWKNYDAIEFLTDYSILKSRDRLCYFIRVLYYCISRNYTIIGLFRKNHLKIIISRIYAKIKWNNGLCSYYLQDENIETVEIPDKIINNFLNEINNKNNIINIIKPHLQYFYLYEEIYEKNITIKIELNKTIELYFYNKKLLEKQKERLNYVRNLDKLPEYIKNYDYDKDFK